MDMRNQPHQPAAVAVLLVILVMLIISMVLPTPEAVGEAAAAQPEVLVALGVLE